MAKQLNVELGIRANASQAKQEIQSLMTSLNSISIKGLDSTDKKIKNASQAAKELAYHLNNAFDASTGKLDLSRFDASLKKSNSNVQTLANNLLQSGSAGQTAFLQLSSSISQANFPMVKLNGSLREMMTTLKNTARWQLSSSILHGFMGAVQSAYGYAQDLNASLNDIRIVTGKSAAEMDVFAKKANAAAQALSASTLAYTKAALIYYQQGLPADEVEERTNVTVKMANVTKDSAEDVSSYMTAIWNNFDDGSKSLEYYADVMTKLGAATAASTSEIADGLEKFASIGETVGLSYEYATATVATVVDKTRASADTIGTAFKTIFSRLQGLKLGETLDDDTTLNKYSSALQAVGISIKDSDDELRDMDDILDDLGEKWATLHRDEKMALAQTVAGTRQYTQLISLMDNYDAFKLNVDLAENSEGELQNQADIYAESWDAAKNRVQASLEEIYDELLNDKFFIGLSNGLANLIHGVDNFIDAIGGVKGAVIGIGSLILTMFSDKIGPALATLKLNIATIFTGAQAQVKKLSRDINALRDQEMNRKNADGTDVYNQSGKTQLAGDAAMTTARMKLSMASKNMTDQEKQLAEFTLRSIQAQQDECQAIADKIVKLEEEKEAIINLENASVQTSSGKATYDDTVDFLQANVDTAQQRYDNATSTKQGNAAWTELQDSRESLAQFQDTSLVLDEALRSTSQTLGTFFDQIQNGTVDVQACRDAALEPFVNVLDELNQKTNDTSGFSSQDAALDAYKEQLQLIIRSMPDLGQNAKGVEKALKKALNAGNMKGFKAALGGIKKELKAGGKEAEALSKGFRRLDPKKFKALEDQAKKAGKTLDDLKKKQEGVNKSVKDFNPKHTAGGLEKIAAAAAGFGQVAMMIGSFKSMVSALNDEDMSFGDKLATVLTSVSMLVPSVIGAFKNLKTAFADTAIYNAVVGAYKAMSGALTGLVTKISAAIVIKRLESGADALSIASKLGITAALEAEGIALDANTAKTVLSTAATELKNGATLKEALATGLSAIGISTETAAKVANKVATGAATAAQWAFNAAFYASPIGWVVGLIIALIAVLTGLIFYLAVVAAEEAKVVETEKNAGEAAAKATEQYNQLKEAYESLKQSIKDYDDALKAFQELKKGSSEYAEALEKVNEQAEKLIETYPELASQWSYGQNGEIIFDEGALDYIAAQQESSVRIAEAYMNAANSRHIEAQRDLVYQNTGYKSEEKQAKLDALGNLTDAQYNAIKNMNYLVGNALTDFAEGIGLTVDEVTSLSEVIKDLGSDADSTHEKLQSLNNQEEYYIEQQARSMVQFQGLYEGNVNAQNAYANLLAQNEDYQNKTNENATKANKGKESDIKDLLAGRDDKWHDYNDGLGFGGMLTDKELMQAYAQYVEGWSEEELNKAVYDGGNGSGTLSTEGRDDLKFTDDYMRQALTSKLLSDQMISESKLLPDPTIGGGKLLPDPTIGGGKLLPDPTIGGGADPYNSAGIQDAVDKMLDASQNVSDIMLNSFSNYSKDEGLNFDYSLFSEDERNEMLNVADQMGGEYGEAVKEALANYDEQFYLDRLEEVQNTNMDQTIEKEGLDADAIELQTELLQDNTDALKENKNAAKQLAINNARMNKGMSTLIDNWKDWSKVLKSGNKKTTEYAETLADMQSCIGDLVGLSDEMEKSLSADFLGSADTIALLEKAANADAAAVEELGFAVANDLVSNMQIADSWIDAFNESKVGVTINGKTYSDLASLESAFNTTKANVLGYINEISNASLGVGDSIGNAIGPENVQDFVNGLNEMAMATNMSVESMQGMLSSMGVEATVESKWVDETIMAPKYRTVKSRTSWDPKTGESTYDEVTYPIGEVPVEGGRYVASVTYDGSRPDTQINYVGHGGASKGNQTAAQKAAKKDSTENNSQEEKDVKKETDRYHVIKNQLEDVTSELDAISKAKDRAFGPKKLKLMDAEIAKTEELIKKNQEYLRQIKENYNQERAELAKFGAAFDKNGTIANYDALIQSAVEKYNAAVQEFNKHTTDDKAAKAAFKVAEKEYDRFKELIAQYEEDQDLIKEIEQKIQDQKDDIFDAKLEKIDYKVNLQIEFSDDELEQLEYLLERIENKAFSASEAIANLGLQTQSVFNKNDAYKSGIMKIFGQHGLSEADMNAWLAGDKAAKEKVAGLNLTENEVEKLREYTSGLRDTSQAMIELREAVHEKILSTFEEMNEKLDSNIEKLEHLQSLTESYGNIIDLVGKANFKDSDKAIKALNASKVAQAGNIANANIDKRDMIAANLQRAKDTYAQQYAILSEEERKMWEDSIAEMETQLNEAEEAAMSSIESWMEAINDQFIAEVEATMDRFSESVAGKFKNLTELQEAFERKQSENDRYLEDYEKIYEFSKLNRDIEKSIDNTDNIKAKKELANLQAEINELEESGAEVSEYQMENLRKRYELKLAELALEEAQNAKSEVRMTRDSEGNWGYVYTADEAQVAEAEQSYEDKLYELQQQNAEYINTLQENIIQMQVEMKEKMAEIANDESLRIEERQAKMAGVQADYKEQMDSYCSELGVALGNNKTLYEDDWIKYSEATGYKIAEDAKYIDSFEETDLAILTGFTNMEGYQAAFNAASDTMLADNNTAFENWQSAIETGPLAAMDTSFDTLAENIDGHLDTIDQESDNTKEAIKEDCEDAVENYQGVVDAVVAWETQYSASVTNMIADSDTLITKFQEVLALWADVKAAANEELPTPDDGSGGGDGGDGGSGGGGGGGAAALATEAAEIITGVHTETIPQTSRGWVPSAQDMGYSTKAIQIAINAFNDSKDGAGYSYCYEQALKLVGSYDTGGYTGEWGDASGRLALLHQKELVLNEDDTSNFLSAIEMIRQISSMIDLNAMSSMKGLGGMLTAGGVGQTMGGIEQHIEIHASFPDANDHSEIEEAFNNLLNSASQYANRKV